jgi:uncharacterized membrane protein YdjX (TVP38/TMEM64 family)
MKKNITFILLSIIALVVGITCMPILMRSLSLKSVSSYRTTLLMYTRSLPITSRFIYWFAYIFLITIFVPAGAVLNLLGGFLFGAIEGTILANTAATIGAFINLITVRYIIGRLIQSNYTQRLEAFNKAFDKNGTHYLLSIRLLGVIPYPIINTLIAFTKARFWPYMWTTFIGIIPGQFVFAFMGKQLGTIQSVNEILTWNVLGSFLLLALFALLPTVFKKQEMLAT